MRAVFVFLRDKFMRAGLVLLIVIVEVMAIYWFGQSSFTQPFINQCKQPNEICNIIINSRGAWTLITLIVSAPVAYVIWFFRDANTQKQIENQRKDVNLKEFQKIAEWVSGAHLVEEKIIEKSKDTGGLEKETACEYSRQPEKQNIATFSKQDGAVGLQIAAIYMLLPFYRGDHGEDFRRPAFNLLTAAWLSLFSKVENIQEGQALAEKPLAVAITEVFFAEGGLVYSTEAKYKHLLVNLYLPFVNLTLPGLSEKALRVFAGKNCRGIDLHGAILQETYLENADLKGTNLWGVNFTEANLRKVDLRWANLRGAKLWGTDLREADLTEAYVMEADFMGADLGRVNLQNANLGYVYLEGTHLERANLRCANLFGAQLSERKFNQLSIDVNQAQKADFIILALVEPTVSTHSYQLTATRKTETSTHWIGEKFKRTIFSYQLNVQKTKELNQANWEIEIKELPSNTP